MFSDAFQWHFPVPPEGDWLTVIVDLLRPLSRNGEVKLNSADPHQQPYINLNFFSNELDILALREGVRFVDDILMTGDGMKEILGEDYPWPMPRHSDEAMNKMILERSQTGYRKLLCHSACTRTATNQCSRHRPLRHGPTVQGHCTRRGGPGAARPRRAESSRRGCVHYSSNS